LSEKKLKGSRSCGGEGGGGGCGHGHLFLWGNGFGNKHAGQRAGRTNRFIATTGETWQVCLTSRERRNEWRLGQTGAKGTRAERVIGDPISCEAARNGYQIRKLVWNEEIVFPMNHPNAPLECDYVDEAEAQQSIPRGASRQDDVCLRDWKCRKSEQDANRVSVARKNGVR